MHEMARTHPCRIDEVVDRAGRDALDLGLMERGGENLFGNAPRLQKAWK